MKTTASSIHVPVLILLLAALALPDAARGQATDGREQAKEHFKRGVALYNEGDYRGSLVEFKRANELSPNPKVLFNIGQNLYQLQDYAAALKTLERYLAEASGDDPQRPQAQQTLDVLRSRVSRLEILVSQPGAEVSIDDEPVGKAPLPGPVPVSIGKRKITVQLTGRPAEQRFVEVAAGDQARVNIDLPALAVGAGPEDAARSHRMWMIGTWTAAGAFAVTSAILGGVALSASSDLKDTQGRLGATREDLDAAASKSKNLALTTDIFIGATAVTTGIAVYLTLTRPRPVESPSKVSATLDILPAGLGLRGSF